ncbi:MULTISPECIES: heat-inducible transcriptional repressor HrcA [Brevibacillus]|jgi:heat-inducible transcriptional repressor|uniref:Heat-inducible transcription repressor HrcA n=1 Tax=Brevibacillus borstelensis AK1 TaxID=1300222 RepID=M8DBN1_9BACL|nr:heat-inducible transcriptional repressor HrcA [Brevibacillus borstelensis]EMT50762.1 heat-inducible transcription repressor HrcA [Brevibacillus borstelensis AK1]KKX55922.1 HrcA family transcriptional regulator [Brevibacillus borstelensis cifa_chp40]MBE5396745.1 heat-inducible transcriptional repressor HrcA [Brevibacillus borstelensis]MCC0564483.1 heat-inducible transcriptional repressor HrcA [Brevibacillus borstelensis]MCM3559637.1 heat-inducible transcriptional repressor HrcA [Brevibacillu
MLSDRQRLILNAIVDNYIHSAEPVGSRTISKKDGIGFSSATIRNEMADLEELGYLEQPHTSAGRVPSTKGYRFYVDNLIQPHLLNDLELGKLKQLFAERIHHFEQVIEYTAQILSHVTNYTAIVLGPEIFEHRLKHIQIVPLNEEQAVAIVVTNTGRVENKLIDLPKGVRPQEIEKLVNILNTKLSDVPLWQLRQRLYQEIAGEMRRHVEQYEEMLHILEDSLTREEKERVYLRGATKIMNQPEFRDVDKVKDILELLERNDQLIHLFGAPAEGLTVRIGQENQLDAIKQCSIITTSYSLGGKPVGMVGILGPTRMEYSKVITVLNYLAEGLSQMLTSEFEK